MDIKPVHVSCNGWRPATPWAVSTSPAPQSSVAAQPDAGALAAALSSDAAGTSVIGREFSPLMKDLQAWSQRLFDAAGSAAASDAAAADATGAAQDYSGTFSLEVKTREGDTVTIHFNEGRTRGASSDQVTEASYEVEGDLSADERKALDQLVGKMVDIADTFFSGTTGFGRLAVVDNLDFFDAGQLAGFALDVGQDRRKMGNRQSDRAYSSFSLDYDVDLDTKTQHLRSALVSGYQQADGAGQQRHGYDLTSAIDPAGKQLLDRTDVRGLGKPGLYQSGPTALPAYYQGALQALSGNIDCLSELAEQTAAQNTLADPEAVVTDLFRGLAKTHPAYLAAAGNVQQSLGRFFDMLPSLLRQAPALNAHFHTGSVRTTA